MNGLNAGLAAHLKTGCTTICRCWALTRRDGVVLGFTDHDGPLSFEGIEFRADTGLTALALQQTTGFAVDNTEALGALSDAAISEGDIEAGRYDGAELRAWLVNWRDVAERALIFRGHVGEIRRSGGAFEAELRGLTDALNQPVGRVYQKSCGAVLGDAACGFDLNTPGYFAETVVQDVAARRVFRFDGLAAFAAGWFRHGTLRMNGGAAEGLQGTVKDDRFEDGRRVVELWQPLRAAIVPGDPLRLRAGCDKQPGTCRFKFSNFDNYQGFPDLPGDDWTLTDPSRAADLDGGSRRG